VTLTSLLEQLLEPENRATLDPDASDMYPVPLPHIAYRLGDYIQAGLAAARDAHDVIFAALGARFDAAEGAGHIMGTDRMGNDAKDSG
jgi:glucose dehydrogenase